jgi:hypothetical protein
MNHEPRRSRPSEAALRAAACKHTDEWDHLTPRELERATIQAMGHPVLAILTAAHDPALGLDRSVRLGDIVEWLRTDDGPTHPEHEIADQIAREFGGQKP